MKLFRFRKAYLRFLIWIRVKLSTKNRAIAYRQLFLVNVLFTRVYEKQSLQDKITSLSKLISIFEADHGFIPKLMLRVLYRMNGSLNREVVMDFERSYQRDVDVRTA